MTFESRKHTKSAWTQSKKNNITEKPWGHEIHWAGFDGIHGKTLFIKQGKRTSLKYHTLKSEVLFLRSGTAQVTYGDELSLVDPVCHEMITKIIEENDVLMVQSGSPYRIEAITDCEIIEIGNNHSDSPIRIKDDYGRESRDR